MRLYEVIYIFDAAIEEAAVNQKLEEYHALVTADNGGEITAVDHWGARQLAYPIKKQKTGYFVVAQFKSEPVSLPEFERLLKLDDQVLRYLVVLNEGEPTTGMSTLAPRSTVAVEREEDDGGKGKGEEEEAESEAEPRTSPPEFSGGRGRRRRVEGPPIQLLNYKDVSTLSRFLTEQGKILPKRTTKVTARFQRQLGTAVKRARYLSLLPYVRDHEA
ncbi:MAG: 30S ribosomal protein S6 [Gemmatimonadetes bacterium]|nr:30S ribosomal protein S6 [Gemmatimonadota bacterium]